MGLQKESRPLMFPKIGRWGIIVVAFVIIYAGTKGFQFYLALYKPSVVKNGVIYIRENDTFEQVSATLEKEGYLANPKTFAITAQFKKYNSAVRPGAYKIIQNWNNTQLVNTLRSGAQTPVNVTFNNIRQKESLAGRLGKSLMADSLAFLSMLNNDSLIAAYGFTRETFPALFIPNSYQFYWTTTPLKFAERMKQEYDKFWNESRKAKAARLGFTPVQVATLASIVQEESNKNDEKPTIAGVYINRLRNKWPLQADPTIKFALGDFTIKRILNEQLTTDSPYNTYKNIGLPPGPINFPEISSLEAVLNAPPHNYFYFCAKEDFSGYHNFATSLSQHNANARKYQAELNRRKIFK